jgi:hypothetical protein
MLQLWNRAAMLALIAFPVSLALAADPQAQFNELYGEQARKVVPKDAAAFAEQLIRDASRMTDDPDMADFVVNKAMEFWQRALKGPEKDRIGQTMLRRLLSAGDKPWSSGKYSQAAEAYQKASTVAKAIKSADAPVIAARQEIAKARANAEKNASDLEAKLKTDPKDTAALKKLVLLMVLDLNNPRGAQGHLENLADPVLKKNVALAAQDPDEILPEAAKDLATWYKSMAAGASVAGKDTANEKIAGYGLRFLTEHTKKDAIRVIVRKQVAEAVSQWQTCNLLPESLSSFIEKMDFSLDSDALGTWKYKDPSASTVVWTYVIFGKNGTCATVSQQPYGVQSDKWRWVTKDNLVSVNPDSNFYPSFAGFPIPAQDATGPVQFVSTNWNTSTITMERATPGAFQLEIQSRLDPIPTTRIPGTWKESVSDRQYPLVDAAVRKFIFRDDGVVTELCEHPADGETLGGRSIGMYRWKIQDGELVIGGKAYRFPYPLKKEGTHGRAIMTYKSGGVEKTTEAGALIELDEPKPAAGAGKGPDGKD